MAADEHPTVEEQIERALERERQRQELVDDAGSSSPASPAAGETSSSDAANV